MILNEKTIEEMFSKGELKDSDQRILVYLEAFGVGKFPLSQENKQNLPNATKICRETGLAAITTSKSLNRLNMKGLIVYSRLGMQKKAVLTENGLLIVNYIHF